MTFPRIAPRLIGLLLAVGLAGGCAANAAPLVPTGLPALNAPEPPARVVVPAPEPSSLPPVAEPPAAATPAKPVRDRGATPPAPPATPPPTEPPAEPPAGTPPPPVLRTPADTVEFETHVRGRLFVAQTDLARVRRQNLPPEARAQWDSAAGFIRQAEAALKVKNLVYASQLAEKAATMAALLRR